MYSRFIPESPRWVMLHRRDKGRQLLKNIAACNGVELEDDLIIFSDVGLLLLSQSTISNYGRSFVVRERISVDRKMSW